VNSVCFHTLDKTHKSGVYPNLRCCGVSSYGGCGAKLVGPILMSIERPTTVDYSRYLGHLIHQDHDPTCIVRAQKFQAIQKDAADATTKRPADEGTSLLNTNKVLILHNRLNIIQEHTAQVNKTTLEVREGKGRTSQPKRVDRTTTTSEENTHS
jgi:hypothetical protein